MFLFFFKQKTAYEMLRSLVGSEMCIRDSARSDDAAQRGPLDSSPEPAPGPHQVEVGQGQPGAGAAVIPLVDHGSEPEGGALAVGGEAAEMGGKGHEFPDGVLYRGKDRGDLLLHQVGAVSYTHLTLPTIDSV